MPDLSAPLAQGRTAEVYLWNNDHILKLYHTWCPPHWVEQEFQVARALCQAGIPTPAATEMVSVEGRGGIIYERVNGISMLEDLRHRPWLIFQYARSLAELHAQIHRQTVPGLHSYRDGLNYSIKHAPDLTETQREKALARLNTQPEQQTLCHGDFHPANVLISPRGPVVIDWMTASLGSPWADVARTSLILTIGVKAAGNQVTPLLRLFAGLLHQTYLSCYHSLVPGGHAEFKDWQPIIAAARMSEQIEPEREALRQMAAML